MIIANIIGGLGNQMFQYAFGYAIAKKNQDILKLDISEFESYNLRKYELDKYQITGKFASIEEIKKLKYVYKTSALGKLLQHLSRKPVLLAETYYKEPYSHFDKKLFDVQGDLYFEGYWQSEKYFLEYRNELLELFTLKEDAHNQCRKYKQKIISTESIGLHVRRGDYITNAHTNSVHGTCDTEYYRKAVFFMKSMTSNPHFFIFSDDIAWAKANLNFIDQISFVEFEYGITDHEEMYLMSQCNHNIIANSSFSWWGAWLNRHPDKIVISPKRWFADESRNTSDLIPASWVRL
jgi:hypothetical protein